ncbi:MAG TPA: RidA family protein [Mycobacteriales bacterium]|nr:RidA family protein [Mycobacteriales bacterium]
MTGHRVVNPPELGPAVGFSHAVVAAPGRVVYLGGQVAQGADGVVVGGPLVEQFDIALGNVVTALRAAGAAPEHLVRLTVYTTVPDDYRAALGELGAAYRKHLGKHYPAMAFFAVSGLFDPAAVVELLGTAVVPEVDA